MNIIIVPIAILLILIILYLFLICPDMTRRDQMQPFIGQMFAHRGYHNAAKRVPENSMLAFTKAIEKGYGIELDVHLTADRQLVVFHDDNIKRICGVDGIVEHMTFEELQQYYLSGTFEKMPLFTEVLEHVHGRVPLLIEVKMPGKDTLVCKYIKEVLDDYKGPFLVESFNSIALNWFRSNAPAYLRGQLSPDLVHSKLNSPLWVRFAVKHLLSNWYCSPDFIAYKLADSHNSGLWLNQHLFKAPLAAWTLRTPEAIEEAKKNFQMYIFEEKC